MPLDPQSTLCYNCQDGQIPGNRCPRWCTGQAREEKRATEAVRRTEGLTHPHETSPHDPGALLCEARRRERPAANQTASTARKLRAEHEGAEDAARMQETMQETAQRKEAREVPAAAPQGGAKARRTQTRHNQGSRPRGCTGPAGKEVERATEAVVRTEGLEQTSPHDPGVLLCESSPKKCSARCAPFGGQGLRTACVQSGPKPARAMPATTATKHGAPVQEAEAEEAAEAEAEAAAAAATVETMPDTQEVGGHMVAPTGGKTTPLQQPKIGATPTPGQRLREPLQRPSILPTRNPKVPRLLRSPSSPSEQRSKSDYEASSEDLLLDLETTLPCWATRCRRRGRGGSSSRVPEDLFDTTALLDQRPGRLRRRH